MLNQMIDWTRANGGRKVYVDTGVDEKKAIRFYERNGFSREAILKDWYDDGDERVFYEATLFLKLPEIDHRSELDGIHALPSTSSGGMKRRLTIARVLARVALNRAATQASGAETAVAAV